jgi:hypothetical protein
MTPLRRFLFAHACPFPLAWAATLQADLNRMMAQAKGTMH